MAQSWWLKLDRTEKHLKEVDEYVRDYVNKHPYRPVRSLVCSQHGDCWRYTLQITEQPDPMLSVIVGDAVHNMRSALDHIAVAIAPKRRKYDASFPIVLKDIEDSSAPTYDAKAREGFDSAVKGMVPDAVAVIKNLQPYTIPDETDRRRYVLTILSRLDNADKHRELTTVGTGLIDAASFTYARGGVMGQYHPADGFVQDGTEIAHFGDTGTPRLAEPEVNVQVSGTPAIAMDIGLDEVYIGVSSLQTALAFLRKDVMPLLEPFVRV